MNFYQQIKQPMSKFFTKEKPRRFGRGITPAWNSETNKQRHRRFSYLLKLWCADASHTKARPPRMQVHVIDVCDTAVSDKIVPTMLCIIALPKNVFLFSMIVVFCLLAANIQNFTNDSMPQKLLTSDVDFIYIYIYPVGIYIYINKIHGVSIVTK
jgi:hypothetical protein